MELWAKIGNCQKHSMSCDDACRSSWVSAAISGEGTTGSGGKSCGEAIESGTFSEFENIGDIRLSGKAEHQQDAGESVDAWKRMLRLDGLIRASRFLIKKYPLLRQCLKKLMPKLTKNFKSRKWQNSIKIIPLAPLFSHAALRFSTAVSTFMVVSLLEG